MGEFIDLERYDGEAEIEADVCIAGAGAAGITLARDLAARKVGVVLLESGGRTLEGATQALYQASQSGIPYFDLTACRLRYLGGTTNHWGGYTNFNTDLDFAGNPDIDLPPWPVDHGELEPWLRETAALLGIDYGLYEPRAHVAAAGIDPAILIENSTDKFDTIPFPQTRLRRFAELFADELAASPEVRPFLHANLVRIATTPDGSAVDSFVARSLGGREIRVRAKRYVLACHAIENARMLLVSNDVHTAGIGNRYDMVGRYFMDHIHIEDGEMLADELSLPRLYYRDRRDPQNRHLDIVAQVNERTRREESMLSYYIRFHVVHDDERTYRALNTLRGTFLEPYDERVARAAATVAGDFLTAGRLLQERAGLRPRRVSRFVVDNRIDQAPNRDSRITLVAERDALGLNRINLHWDLTELDVHSFNRGRQLAVQEFAALGFGRITPQEYDMDFVRENVVGHYHHLGTTRMGASASSGVVDGDCRVHDVPNLLVAGSSTFPTAGASGPTMTIVAMAKRMADTLARELGA